MARTIAAIAAAAPDRSRGLLVTSGASRDRAKAAIADDESKWRTGWSSNCIGCAPRITAISVRSMRRIPPCVPPPRSSAERSRLDPSVDFRRDPSHAARADSAGPRELAGRHLFVDGALSQAGALLDFRTAQERRHLSRRCRITHDPFLRSTNCIRPDVARRSAPGETGRAPPPRPRGSFPRRRWPGRRPKLFSQCR